VCSSDLTGNKGKPSEPMPPAEENGEIVTKDEAIPAVVLPDHPSLDDIENLSLRELQHVTDELFSINKKQRNAQIEDIVKIAVTLDPQAAPGDREIRLLTPAGFTNPMRFRVGLVPETLEREPNDPGIEPVLSDAPPVELPAVVNGQILPGDVDRFRFRAARGQKLVIQAEARALIPYLADAVPGWFQATVAIYDSTGNELAFADDYVFDPDPVLYYEFPEDGEYELEVHDSIYRGREDFVYRVSMTEQPFITSMFPLGGPIDGKTAAKIRGWNLPKKRLRLDTDPDGDTVRKTALTVEGETSNEVLYAVDSLPECEEAEPNDTVDKAQPIRLPCIVNGRILQPGDEDVFQFEGCAGDEIVAEVCARRLHSALDSLLRLVDASGNVLEWNDDHEDPASGLLTHHADSYLRARLPEDGVYRIQLTDSQAHGGEAYAYRLRIGSPQPDFALRATPSSLKARVGRSAVFRVHAIRRDGFDGAIDIALKGAPVGFLLDGARIPCGRDSVYMTLTAPQDPIGRPVALELEGRAEIGGQTVVRRVVPAEDMMQAFAYQHLTPVMQWMVTVKGDKRIGGLYKLAETGPVRIPAGGTAPVRFTIPKYMKLKDIQVKLEQAPAGLSVADPQSAKGELTLVLKAGEGAPEPSYADNLIVSVSGTLEGNTKNKDKPVPDKPMSLGVLPAIAFEIVPAETPSAG
ncbi:MAG: hypothetical protein QG656_151, partial [Candidatus Hydrogenedentes bacterium]|nr:hypothetical protein [Candidatus Hydrogenedentota bacterium]